MVLPTLLHPRALKLLVLITMISVTSSSLIPQEVASHSPWKNYINDLRSTPSSEIFRKLAAPLAALVNQTYTGTNGSTYYDPNHASFVPNGWIMDTDLKHDPPEGGMRALVFLETREEIENIGLRRGVVAFRGTDLNPATPSGRADSCADAILWPPTQSSSEKLPDRLTGDAIKRTASSPSAVSTTIESAAKRSSTRGDPAFDDGDSLPSYCLQEFSGWTLDYWGRARDFMARVEAKYGSTHDFLLTGHSLGAGLSLLLALERCCFETTSQVATQKNEDINGSICARPALGFSTPSVDELLANMGAIPRSNTNTTEERRIEEGRTTLNLCRTHTGLQLAVASGALQLPWDLVPTNKRSPTLVYDGAESAESPASGLATTAIAISDDRRVVTLADEFDPVYHDARRDRGLRGGSAKCVWRGKAPFECRRCFRVERHDHVGGNADSAGSSAGRLYSGIAKDEKEDEDCAMCFAERHVYGHYLDLVANAERPICRP